MVFSRAELSFGPTYLSKYILVDCGRFVETGIRIGRLRLRWSCFARENENADGYEEERTRISVRVASDNSRMTRKLTVTILTGVQSGYIVVSDNE
jgi:hypothetical protein